MSFKKASFLKKKDGDKSYISGSGGDFSFMKRKVRVNMVINDVKEYTLEEDEIE